MGGGKVRSVLFYSDLKKLDYERYYDFLTSQWIFDICATAADAGVSPDKVHFFRDNDSSRDTAAEDFFQLKLIKNVVRSPDLMPHDFWAWRAAQQILDDEEDEYFKQHGEEMWENYDQFCERVKKTLKGLKKKSINKANGAIPGKLRQIIAREGALIRK